MPDNPPTPEPPTAAARQIQEGMEHFQRAMTYRSEMNIRVARRVTGLIRWLLFGAAAIQIVGFLLVSLLSNHMNDLITTVTTMNRHMTSMAADMGVMRGTMERMEGDVRAVNTITTEVTEMRGEMEAMDSHVTAIADRLRRVNANMAVMSRDVGTMSRNLVVMQHDIGNIGGSVNRMSAPIRMFNQMNPLR